MMKYKIDFFKNYVEKLTTEIINISPAIIGLVMFLLCRSYFPDSLWLLLVIFSLVCLEIFLSFFNIYTNARIEIFDQFFLIRKGKTIQKIAFEDMLELSCDLLAYRKTVPYTINITINTHHGSYVLSIKNLFNRGKIIWSKHIINHLLYEIDKKMPISKLMTQSAYEILSAQIKLK